MKAIRFGLMVVCMAVATGYGATVTRTVADGDWASTNEWNISQLPSTGDNAILNNNRHVTVSTTISEMPDAITINNQNTTLTTSSTLTISENGSLSASGSIYVGANDAIGIVSIASGGALSAGTNFVLGHNNGIQPSALEFILGESGFIHPISVPGIFYIRPSQKLIVDATDYTGTGPVDLLTFGSLNGSFDPGNISIIGLDGASITYDGNSMTLAPSPYTESRATVAALGNLTNAPTMFADDITMATTNVNAGELNSIYFDALDYNGNPTRVYAYVGIPAGASAGSPVPGIVLVHGGGGTAFDAWVTKWTDQGYAAISIAVEGQTDSKEEPTINTGWHIHNMPGPVRDGIYGDSDEALTNQWMYHAVADTVLANSLLRSLPEVVSTNVGVMGVSWGGVITSTTIGIDDRFAFAVPTYGCGSLATSENQYGAALGDNDLYKEVWDPMVRIANVEMPVLWSSWPQDVHFPMDSLADCYTNAPGPRMVSLVSNMGHGHAAAWNRPESYAFANSVMAGTPWCMQQSVSLSNNLAEVVFNSTATLGEARLVSTLDVGFTGARTWVESAAVLINNGNGTYTTTATLPEFTTAWFINVLDGTTVASSDYQEVQNVAVPSNVVYDVTANWSSKTTKGNDVVTITSNATVTLDQSASVLSITLDDGNLQMNQDVDLVVNNLNVNDGMLNQTDGLITAAGLTVESGGLVALIGGTMETDIASLTLNGDIMLNGGTLSSSIFNVDPTVNGSGTLRVQLGVLNVTDGTATELTKMQFDMEVSGGLVDWSGQLLLDAPAELTVIGDEATISLDQFSGQSDGTVRFVLDETGVSPLLFSSWINMGKVVIEADGSAYTGGATNMTLFDSSNLAGAFDSNNFSASGFSGQGLEATMTQNDTDDWVQLVLVENAYGTWASSNGLSGAEVNRYADPDEDQLDNWGEYALGGNPKDQTDLGYLPILGTFSDAGSNIVEFIYARRLATEDELSYSLESTSNLTSNDWNISTYTELPTTGTINADFESVTNRVDTAGKSKEFIRLKIEAL